MKNTIVVYLIIVVIFSLLSLHLDAQSLSKPDNYWSNIGLNIGVGANMPIGSSKSNYAWSLGGAIQGDFPIVKRQLLAIVNVGYTNSFAKNSIEFSDRHQIPVKAGLKYYPVRFLYLEGEADESFITNRNAIRSAKSSYYVNILKAGVKLNISAKIYVQTGLEYQNNAKFFLQIKHTFF
jgi:hypothetical protein